MSQCQASKYIGDAEGGGQFDLACDLDTDAHVEAMHWDQALEIIWAHWTAADEQEFRDEIASGDAVGGHGARGEPGTGPHEPTETAAARSEEGGFDLAEEPRRSYHIVVTDPGEAAQMIARYEQNGYLVQ